MSTIDIHPSRLSLGVKVSVITSAQYRYEGTVAAINSIEGTLTLQNVCFWGPENRIAENVSGQVGEKKIPAVGSIFNLITFWMSSIIQVWLSHDDVEGKGDICDKGIAKAGVPVDLGRGRVRRSKNWWQSGDQSRQKSHQNGLPNENINSMPLSVGRYSENLNHSGMQTQPRMLVSYPRRGRYSSVYPRQTGYVPIVPVMQGPGGSRRSGYNSITRSSSYRGRATPVSSGLRNGGRRAGPTMRHAMGAGDDYRYNQSMMDTAGGVLVYLPPDMAAAYQSHGINFVSSRPSHNRRRVGERKNASRITEATEPEIDCTTPYDFEAANAEFKEELEKITINSDGIPVTINSQSGLDPSSRQNESSSSTGENQTVALRSPQSSAVSASGNGASGDSTRGGVTLDSQATVNADGNGPLAKGEYYVREKCFFDQISRPDSGPRQGVEGNRTSYGGRGSYGPSVANQNRRLTYGTEFNSFTAARRERQLNMETFGSMAARASFIPRRRGPPPREYLVTAPA